MAPVIIFAGEEIYDLDAVSDFEFMPTHFGSIRGRVAERFKTKAKVIFLEEFGMVRMLRPILSPDAAEFGLNALIW